MLLVGSGGLSFGQAGGELDTSGYALCIAFYTFDILLCLSQVPGDHGAEEERVERVERSPPQKT